mmetsp:Transcript_44568/g.127149  ORF Transcript_44568/g.127149 Transcript_44568/m.127149 type:complete len:267 (+) Transcript_44568:292-1092(+)
MLLLFGQVHEALLEAPPHVWEVQPRVVQQQHRICEAEAECANDPAPPAVDCGGQRTTDSRACCQEEAGHHAELGELVPWIVGSVRTTRRHCGCLDDHRHPGGPAQRPLEAAADQVHVRPGPEKRRLRVLPGRQPPAQLLQGLQVLLQRLLQPSEVVAARCPLGGVRCCVRVAVERGVGELPVQLLREQHVPESLLLPAPRTAARGQFGCGPGTTAVFPPRQHGLQGLRLCVQRAPHACRLNLRSTLHSLIDLLPQRPRSCLQRCRR